VCKFTRFIPEQFDVLQIRPACQFLRRLRGFLLVPQFELIELVTGGL